MEYTTWDLGFCPGGTCFEISLRGTEANVTLMDSDNLAAFDAEEEFEYYGGHFDHSPIILEIPYDDYWHLVLDLDGDEGRTYLTFREV